MTHQANGRPSVHLRPSVVLSLCCPPVGGFLHTIFSCLCKCSCWPLAAVFEMCHIVDKKVGWGDTPVCLRHHVSLFCLENFGNWSCQIIRDKANLKANLKTSINGVFTATDLQASLSFDHILEDTQPTFFRLKTLLSAAKHPVANSISG